MQVHLLRKKSEQNRDVDFFHDNRYSSVFLNIESMSVSVFSNIAISVSIIQPTSTLSWFSKQNQAGTKYMNQQEHYHCVSTLASGQLL